MGENDKVMPLETGDIIASTKVIKRDGRVVEFNSKKIVRALTRAMEKTDLGIDTEIIDRIINSLINSKTFKDSDAVDVDFIQNFIENDLMKSRRKDVAKEYILYRDKRNRNRDSRSKLIKNIKKKLAAKNIENQNANVDEHSFGGRIGEASRIVTKEMALDYCMSEMSRNNHLNNYIYVHDLDSLAVGCHNCLDGSMWVKISKNGNSRVITLENLAKEVGLGKNQLADVSSAGFQVLSRDGWTKLNKVSSRELRPNEELFEIKTKTGLKLILTGDHRLPVIDDTTNTEIIKTVNKLSIGDKLLDSENITLSSEDISDSFLDLTELDDSKVDLRITNLTVLKDYLRYRYKVNFSEYARSNNFQLPASSNTIKLSDYRKLVKDYPLPLEVMCELKLKSSGSKHYYPLFIPYTPQLAKIYAYLYADGGVYINEEESLYQITFTNTNEALIDDFINCYESVFGYRLNKSYPWEKSTSPCIRVTDGTKLIAKLFKDFAGARKYGANDISIPDFVMNGDNTIKYAYLSAAIDTDGCLNPSSISYFSCCKQYCDQMVLLLEGLGYSPHIIKSGNAGDTYRFGSKVGKRNFDSYSVKIYKTDEKYLLQNNMTALKYRDSYCFKGISSKYYKNQIISIKSYIPKSGTNVFDLETESHWFIVNNYVSHNCLSIPFDDLLKNGFNTRQVDIRPANSINTAFQLVAVIFQIQSLQQFGGVSATHLDWTMVPYVRKSYYKHYKEGLEFVLDYTEEQIEQFGINDTMPIDDEKYKSEERAFNYAMKLTIKELNQAAEGMYHNLNSLQSRSGNQLPFTSINYGTCTSVEGRLVIKALLEGSIKGVGKHHRTPIFPCGIFQYMKGVNDKPGTPNYDLYKLALKSTSQRLYPNYANVDWSGNAGYDRNDPRTYFSTMGCRTANGWDINGFGQLKDGRGNICPVTILLPFLAIDAEGDVEKFIEILDIKIHEAADMLIERFEWICSQSPKSAKFMYENNVMAGYIPEEGIRSALKHGTLAIGQLGLAETLQILIGTDHTTKDGMELAKRIEQLFKDRCLELKEKYKLNFGVYYTPAENLCFTAMKKFKEKFGTIPNVSDREFFTNSMHVPVWHELNPFEKIDIESKLTGYSSAGCITYVELPSSTKNNLDALEIIVNYAMNKDIPYFAVNVPNDTCCDCGYCDEFNDSCPECGSKNIQQLRRVTGYLTGDYKTAFNLGKQDEVLCRTKHIKS